MKLSWNPLRPRLASDQIVLSGYSHDDSHSFDFVKATDYCKHWDKPNGAEAEA